MNCKQFFDSLFSYCEGDVELRALPSKNRGFYSIDDYEGMDGFYTLHDHENVYFGVATRNGGGTKEHIKDIPAVWVDIDFKDLPEEQARAKIKELEFRPTYVVESGNGFHVYYKLKEALGQEDIPQIEETNKMLAQFLGGDLAACDASRILRYPDSFNMKYKPARPVKIIFNSENEHELGDIYNILYNTIYTTNTIYDDASTMPPPNHPPGGCDNKCDKSVTKRDIGFGKGRRDDSLFHVANCLIKGGMDEVNTWKVLEILGSNCNPPFDTKELHAKLQSAVKRDKVRQGSLSEEIRAWVRDSSGTFTGQGCDKELQIVTKRDKANRRRILSRLVDEGIIERYGSKNNTFRIIDADRQIINFKDIREKHFDVSYPLQIEQFVHTFPKSIVVIAGEANSGKTAFMLNIIRLNQHKDYNVSYFSSEMGPMELRSRLDKFEDMSINDWNFHAEERAGNFADVIDPDGLNLIDFLELSEEFWKAGGYITDIFNKLNQGVAIIAIQKDKGKDTGRGGAFTLEKPRLYLSISNDYPGHKLKIVKGKNWATDKNPNNMQIKFKIVQGCRIVDTIDWEEGVM